MGVGTPLPDAWHIVGPRSSLQCCPLSMVAKLLQPSGHKEATQNRVGLFEVSSPGGVQSAQIT